MKKTLSSIVLLFALTIGTAQSAIILFPVGLLVYLSPTCDYRPGLCLVLNEEEESNSIKQYLSERYPFLDPSTIGDLTGLVEEKMPESLREDGAYEVSLERDTLLEEILIPSGFYELAPEKSEKLIQDFE